MDSRRFIKKAHKEYVEKLELNTKQSDDLKKILNTYNPKIQILINQKSSHHKINRMIKTSIMEIYKILKPEQFPVFNKIRLQIEPSKKYRLKS